MESSIILGIIGLASALIAILGKILKDLVDVIKSNTELNGSVSLHLQGLNDCLTNHQQSTHDFFGIATPALNSQADLVKMIKQNTDVCAGISSSLAEVSQSQKEILTLVTNNRRIGGHRETSKQL